MERYLICLLIVALIGMTGCGSIGTQQLVPTHEGYNDAVQLAITREVLKNIVRDRYLDPPQYMHVTSINAQFSVSAGASGAATGIGTGNTTGQVGGNIGYSDSPTISFAPKFGAAEYKALIAPIGLGEAMGFVFLYGNFQPHQIALAFGAINDAPDRAGPAGDAYRARVDALARLLAGGGDGQILSGVPCQPVRAYREGQGRRR